MSAIEQAMQALSQTVTVGIRGTVTEVQGLALRVADLPAPLGATVRIDPRRAAPGTPGVPGEVVGFDDDQTIVMPYGSMQGIGRGDPVIVQQYAQMAGVGEALLGRVLGALGSPIDGAGPINPVAQRPLNPAAVDPLDRPVIDTPLGVGVRAIDALLSVGRGQRLGIFAQPGLGKSTLMAQMARQTEADVSVVALIGERGREVRDFIECQLGPEGLARSVVIAATGDEPALRRIRAAMLATAVAEHFRDQGMDVLLLMDSVTRFCQAQRQAGLAAGEPPATKGYPPSVFANLPVLLERSGRTSKGSITGFYTVLVEGDEVTDPVADATRGILDGHVQLSRDLANRGHWPAIDVLASVSRVAPDVTDRQHQAARREVLRIEHDYRQVEDLKNIGAYTVGSNPDFDLAIAAHPMIEQFLQQGMREDRAEFAQTRKQLLAMQQQIQQARQQLASQQGRQSPGAAGRQRS